ncbi:MAG: nitrate/nitrite transporter NrtS [Halocynthiibacter sp.]
MRNVICLALRPDIVRRSLMVSVVVGTILNIINQGDALLGPQSLNLTKFLLTYLVPFCVATYGAVCALNKLGIR